MRSVEGNANQVGQAAADALTQAVVNAILNAESIEGYPSFNDRRYAVGDTQVGQRRVRDRGRPARRAPFPCARACG